MSARRTAIIGGLMVSTGPLSLTLYAPALPSIVADLGASDAGGKLTMSVYFAAFALAQLVCGPLSDRFGRRATGVAFFGIYVLGSLVAIFAPTLEAFLVARLLQGFGVSAGVALSRAMVRDQFTGMDAVRILTMINLILTVAPVLAPTLGSLIMLAGSWHLMFVAMSGFGLAIIVLLTFGAKETLPIAARVPLHPRTIVTNYFRLAVSRDFLQPAILLALGFGGFYGFTALLPFVLMGDFGLSPLEFAMAMLIQTGSFITGNLLAAYLSRRMNAQGLIRVGIACMCLSGLGFAVLPYLLPDSILSVMVPVGVWMLGLATVGPSATASAMSRFGHIAGSAAALTGFFQMGGGFLSSLIAIGAFPDAAGATMIQLPIIAVLVLIVGVLHLRYQARQTD